MKLSASIALIQKTILSQLLACTLKNTPVTIQSAKEYSTTPKPTSDVLKIKVTAVSTTKGSPYVSLITAPLAKESSAPVTSRVKKMKSLESQLVRRRVDFCLCGLSWESCLLL